MSRAFLIALTLLTSSVLAASLDCLPSDSQCLAQSTHDGDESSMIQAHVGTLNVATRQVGVEANVIDLKNKMINITVAGMNAMGMGAMGHMSYGQQVWMAFTSWVIYVVFALLIWYCCYPGPPEKALTPSDIEDPKETFNSGHFSCLSSPSICLCALCCPGLRWADTMSLVGFLKMTTGLSLAFFCAFLNGFAYTAAFFGPFTLLLALYYRQKLREEFQLSSWTCSNLCIDTIYLMLCTPCALAQEARVVTHAIQRGELKSQEVSY